MNQRVSKSFGILFLLLELFIVPKALDLMLNQHLSNLPPMRIVSLSMTFGSIALCILMSFSSMSEHDSYPLHTFLFELMVFLCCLTPLTDLISTALDSAGRPKLNMLVNTAFYLICINLTYVIMLYEFLIIGTENKPALKRVKKWALVLILLDSLATLLNIRFGYFFTITPNGMYQSAPTLWLSFLAPAAIVAVTAITAAREMSPGRQRRAFLSFWIFAVVSYCLHFLLDTVSVQYTGYTLSLVVIYMNVQSELDIFY